MKLHKFFLKVIAIGIVGVGIVCLSELDRKDISDSQVVELEE